MSKTKPAHAAKLSRLQITQYLGSKSYRYKGLMRIGGVLIFIGSLLMIKGSFIIGVLGMVAGFAIAIPVIRDARALQAFVKSSAYRAQVDAFLSGESDTPPVIHPNFRPPV